MTDAPAAAEIPDHGIWLEVEHDPEKREPVLPLGTDAKHLPEIMPDRA